MSNIYYEKCNNNTMITYPIFFKKLKKIQKRSKLIDNICEVKEINKYYLYATTKYYRLSNIIWPNNIKYYINKHNKYPSEYFVKIIMCTQISKKYIINPPIILDKNEINYFFYIHLHYNTLLILDALFFQGSYPRYQKENKYIYSEHAGVISIKDRMIDNIIVSSKTNRIDINDDTIFLPSNSPDFMNYNILFHTHPNTMLYGGRLKEGILYEFPSVNDIFNFIKSHNNGNIQISIIISPEGTYVIRQIENKKNILMNIDVYNNLKDFVLELEKLAISDNIHIINKISNPDIFHKYISQNYKYIILYNKFIEKQNLFIEYYPREKKNNEWCLKQIDLQYISKC